MNSVDQVMLVVDGGPDNDQTIPLSNASTTMGRQSANDVVVAETGVSRKHAEIVHTDNSYYLRDLSSTNGTFVNSEKVSGEDHLLQDGDSIRLGASKISHTFRSPTSSTMAITLDQAADDGEDGTQSVPSAAPPGSPATMITDLPITTELPSKEQDTSYEGNVQIVVNSEGNTGAVVTFMQQLNEKPEMRVLKMANNRDGGVDVSLALREPVPLQRVLGEMDGVSGVDAADGGGEPLTVTLKSEGASACVFCKEPLEVGATVCPSCGKTQA